MKVTVFGGASPQTGQPAYEDACQLGTILARNGHTVLTGGYLGTMEAVSRGAAEAGGYVIGITCEEIENWRSVRANAWVHEEWRCTSLQERLEKLMTAADIVIALPGGVGTFTEITLLWNRILIASLPPRPLILIGSGWHEVFQTFFSQFGSYITERDRRLLSFASNVGEAIRFFPAQAG
ncbi:MAG: LOG family protein [Anaerolineaceae bacterium]|nr:LOG family protein [Anaerolineaceae bacterium]